VVLIGLLIVGAATSVGAVDGTIFLPTDQHCASTGSPIAFADNSCFSIAVASVGSLIIDTSNEQCATFLQEDCTGTSITGAFTSGQCVPNPNHGANVGSIKCAFL